MVTNVSNDQKSIVKAFQGLEVDQQLALFWFIYTEMGESITPAAPAASTASEPIAQGLFDQVKEMSHAEQLQVQRDLITHKNSLISREYGALSDTTKLLLVSFSCWHGTTEYHSMPSDYQLSGQAQTLFEQIKQTEFEQQITIFRDIVSPMGVDSTSAGSGVGAGV